MDRVVEKWGEPKYKTENIWSYEDKCYLFFSFGKVATYSNECSNKFISFDSFSHSKTPFPKELSTSSLFCLEAEKGSSFVRTIISLGYPSSLKRPEKKETCYDNSGRFIDEFSCDTIAVYGNYTNTKNENPFSKCTIFFKDKKIVHINNSCPISCQTLFQPEIKDSFYSLSYEH